MPPTLYLIDGHALAYRTYFALTAGASGGDRWKTSSGELTAGVYGFASVLLRIFEQEHPEYMAVAFDTGRTFRDDFFPAYKATRAKMPDDLRAQIERIRQLVDAFAIPRLEVEGYEADDVLGSVARQAASSGMGVRIITGDRDLLQLVDERIVVNLAGSKLSEAKDYLPEDVVGALGVRPDQVVDYKALVGDSSDNIPGVQGIGEKTAVALLEKYQTLDGVYAHLEETAKGARARLEAGRDSAYLSQKLARIHTDVPITLDLEAARTGRYDPAVVEDIFRELEFRSLVGRMKEFARGKAEPPAVPAAKAETQQLSLFGEEIRVIGAAPIPERIASRVVDGEPALQDLLNEVSSSGILSFDTETTSTDAMRADLVGISLATREGEGYYIPVGHLPGTGEQLPLPRVIDALRAPFTDAKLPKVGHNLKYDFMLLARSGLRAAPLTFDSMLAEWLINPASRNLGLKNLAWIRLNKEMTHIEELIGKGKTQISMAEVPVAAAAAYAADDAEAVLQLMPILQAEMTAQNCTRLLDEIEMPLVTVLADMEMAGIAVNPEVFRGMGEELRKRLNQIELQIYETVGQSFNLNSTQQLSTVLFDRLRLEPPDRRKKTSSGHFSTSADVLEELRGQHEVVDWILEYRELAKLKSTYLDALPDEINPATGRIHTSYNQTGSVTGRLASADPNLQNIPARTELGRKVREGFVA
ncbi:MAG TPA: DNA polymerase I, partial [Anaerolineaceae bacterium]